jgi:beta-xylosidase
MRLVAKVLTLALSLHALPVLACNKTFSNPVIYEDFPDNDISVGPDGAYYFSASNFHFSPGAPILRSEDLVNWDVIGHSIPRLNFGNGYDLLNGERAYRGGTWASAMRYRESKGLWYWIGCTNFWITHIFTAENAEGPWEKLTDFPGTCWYDMGLLVDDDDTMYTVSGNPNVSMAQLSPDGLQITRSEVILRGEDLGLDSLEGNRLYKINGTYYILNDAPSVGRTYIWKSDDIWGPWTEYKLLTSGEPGPLDGGGSPVQGSLVQAAEGQWYFMSFTWAYPAGRMPVLAPLTWDEDGFPVLVKGDNGGWSPRYPMPLPEVPTPAWTGTYTFEDVQLSPRFEWNHNPDNDAWGFEEGALVLSTSSLTDDIYQARNTLTHRIHGKYPVGTVEMDFSDMADGDRAGFAAFRDQTSYIGIHRNGDDYVITALQGAIINEWDGTPVSPGETVATETFPADKDKKIWFRIELDARPTGTRDAQFSYSLDGDEFTYLGDTYKLYDGWAFFLAYRYGIFNFATKGLGGSIRVGSLTVEGNP